MCIFFNNNYKNNINRYSFYKLLHSSKQGVRSQLVQKSSLKKLQSKTR